MNEPAIRMEEQIISLFPDRETQVCQGWVLKKMDRQLFVYPLYYKFFAGDILGNIRGCEEISVQCGAECVFRIVEYTNYHLSSILTDNGYGLKKCGVVGEWNLTEDTGKLCMERKMKSRLLLKSGLSGQAGYVMAGEDMVIGIKRQGLLFLPDGNPLGIGIEDIMRFSMDNKITRILADIPGMEELPKQYGRAGFHKAYLYRCYQKEEKISKEQED